MSHNNFSRYLAGLGSNGRLLIAERAGAVESCAAFGYSEYCAYAVYAGNRADQTQGANKLLYWEAMRMFKALGVRRFDFVGARINPEKGSKQEAVNSLKRRFGATLVKGYMWRYPLRSIQYRLYRLAARVRSGGDIVDAERHKLEVPPNVAR